jgi:hypothetical protein
VSVFHQHHHHAMSHLDDPLAFARARAAQFLSSVANDAGSDTEADPELLKRTPQPMRSLDDELAELDERLAEDLEDEQAEAEAEAGAAPDGASLDWKLPSWLRKKRTPDQKRREAEYQSAKAKAEADKHAAKARKYAPAGDDTAAAALATPAYHFRKEVMTAAELQFADLLEKVAADGLSLAAVEQAALKIASGGNRDCFAEGTHAAAMMLAHLRAEAERAPASSTAGTLKAEVASLSKAREGKVDAATAAKFAAALAALGPAVLAAEGGVPRRGELLADMMLCSAAPALVPKLVAALTDTVRVLQNCLSEGTLRGDTEARMKAWWATSGTSAQELCAAAHAHFYE